MKLFFISLIAAATLLVIAAAVTANRGIRYSNAATIAADSPGEIVVGGGKRAPVIVELFTSEGCSSCPPADAVLSQLERTQPVEGAEVITMSQHVDYWNYIGWADPFSSPAFSARQESYAGAFGADRIYTPQMIVDGQAEFVGSSAAKAREAIARAARAPKAEVTLARTGAAENDRSINLHVSISNLPPISAGDVAEVLLAITENNVSSNVSRGENSGRKLSHASVVRELRRLGNVEPAAKSFNAETSVTLVDGWKRDDLRAIVFVQERAHRQIVGAASLRLSE